MFWAMLGHHCQFSKTPIPVSTCFSHSSCRPGRCTASSSSQPTEGENVVLKEIKESVSSGTKGQSALTLGGRVRSPEMKALVAKQLGLGMQGLENAASSMMDLKTGKIQSKKIKKEKTVEQLAIDEMKKLLAKFLECKLSLLAGLTV